MATIEYLESSHCMLAILLDPAGLSPLSVRVCLHVGDKQASKALPFLKGIIKKCMYNNQFNPFHSCLKNIFTVILNIWKWDKNHEWLDIYVTGDGHNLACNTACSIKQDAVTYVFAEQFRLHAVHHVKGEHEAIGLEQRATDVLVHQLLQVGHEMLDAVLRASTILKGKMIKYRNCKL